MQARPVAASPAMKTAKEVVQSCLLIGTHVESNSPAAIRTIPPPRSRRSRCRGRRSLWQELSRQHAEQDRGDGGEDGSHPVGVEGRAVPPEAVEHDLVEVAGEVAAHGQGAGAAPGHRVEVEEAEIKQIEADDPDDHATQPGPQIDEEGHEVADGDLLQDARELEMILEAQ